MMLSLILSKLGGALGLHELNVVGWRCLLSLVLQGIQDLWAAAGAVFCLIVISLVGELLRKVRHMGV